MSQLLLQEGDLSSTYESHYGILNIREVTCTIFKFVSLSLEKQNSLCVMLKSCILKRCKSPLIWDQCQVVIGICSFRWANSCITWILSPQLVAFGERHLPLYEDPNSILKRFVLSAPSSHFYNIWEMWLISSLTAPSAPLFCVCVLHLILKECQGQWLSMKSYRSTKESPFGSYY